MVEFDLTVEGKVLLRQGRTKKRREIQIWEGGFLHHWPLVSGPNFLLASAIPSNYIQHWIMHLINQARYFRI